MNTWIYVGGTFDLFHYGHARFLQQCSLHGQVLVSLNTDEFASRYKRDPILTLGERIESVKSCRFVSEVIVNIGDEDTGKTIDSIRNKPISHIAHGSDWQGDGLLKQLGISQEWLDNKGISMLYLKYTDSISTSDIIGRVRGNVHSSCDCSRKRVSNDSDGRCTSCSE